MMQDIHRGKTQYVYAINAAEDTAMLFWWAEGAYVYLYQSIDHISGTGADKVNRTYSAVNVDPMSGNDLSLMVEEAWDGFEIMEFNPNYTG